MRKKTGWRADNKNKGEATEKGANNKEENNKDKSQKRE